MKSEVLERQRYKQKDSYVARIQALLLQRSVCVGVCVCVCVCVCMHVCLHVCLCLSIFTENGGAEDEQFLRSGYTQNSSTQEDLLGGNRKRKQKGDL
jgi:hypothetical protein